MFVLVLDIFDFSFFVFFADCATAPVEIDVIAAAVAAEPAIGVDVIVAVVISVAVVVTGSRGIWFGGPTPFFVDEAAGGSTARFVADASNVSGAAVTGSTVVTGKGTARAATASNNEDVDASRG